MRAFSRIGSILIIVVFLYFIFIDIRNTFKLYELKNKKKIYIEQVKKAKERNGQLNKNLIKLQDEKYLEELIRSKLGLVKEGEIIYKFIYQED